MKIGGKLYSVPSFTNPGLMYTVDMNVDVCECHEGLNGLACKHQYILWVSKAEKSSNFLPYLDPHKRKKYAETAFRDFGRGHTAVERFCGLTNMPTPITSKVYEDAIEYMHPLYIESAEQSMNAAAADIRKELLGDDYDEETVVDDALLTILALQD